MRVLDIEDQRLCKEFMRRRPDGGHLRGVEAADRLGKPAGREAKVAAKDAERGAGDTVTAV